MIKTNINERIKSLRKDRQLNQKQFASSLGITQSGVSYMEQNGSTVSDASIKAICSVYNVNEEWLRHGTEPIYIQPPSFSLDQFIQQHGASQLELDIVKAYFELEPELRQHLVQHFKDRLSAAAPGPESAASLELESAATVEAEPSVEELEAEYKKSRSDSVRRAGLSALNTTGDAGTGEASGQ